MLQLPSLIDLPVALVISGVANEVISLAGFLQCYPCRHSTVAGNGRQTSQPCNCHLGSLRNSPNVELPAGVLQRAAGGPNAIEPGFEIGGGFRRAAFDLLGKLDRGVALGLGLLD